MKVDNSVLKTLFNMYRQNPRFKSADVLAAADFDKACQFIEDNLQKYFNWDELSQNGISPELQAILLQSFKTNDNGDSFVFDQHPALAAIITTLQKTMLDRHHQLPGYPGANLVGPPNPSVAKRLSNLQLYHKVITFPGEQADTPLSSIDYQHWIMLVQHKFKSSGIAKVLDEMTIACDSSNALTGLIAYNESRQPLPFKALTLDLELLDLTDKTVRANFLIHLKTMLLTMSNNNLPAFNIVDENKQLSDENISELAEFIKFRPVGIDINLPARFQSSKAQQEIDDAVSDNMRKIKIAALHKQYPQSDNVATLQTEVRKRPKLSGKQNLTIDIELQQEQQADVAVEAAAAISSNAALPDTGQITLYTADEFALALNTGLLDSKANSHLVSSGLEDGLRLWCNWFGALTLAEVSARGLKMSKPACEELLRHYEQFQYGLDLKNLPAGFSITSQGSDNVVHFDENLKLIAPYNPLQVQTHDSTQGNRLTNSQFKLWLSHTDAAHPVKKAWEQISAATYDKTAQRLFKQFLPDMLLLRPKDLDVLFQLTQNPDGSLDSKKLQLLMEHRHLLKQLLSGNSANNPSTMISLQALFKDPSAAKLFLVTFEEKTPEFKDHLLNLLIANDKDTSVKIQHLLNAGAGINQLLQLYVEWGEKGIGELAAREKDNPKLFKQLNSHLFAKSKTYARLFDKDYKDTLTTIQGFNANERRWWDTLLQQHCSAQHDVDLVDFTNAFVKFKGKLHDLKHDAKSYEFPASCELTGVKSLPTALSRILTLLTLSSEHNAHAQWLLVEKLDLSSTGMINPITTTKDKKWAFITPEMNINAKHESPEGIMGMTKGYTVPSSWKNAIDEETFFRFTAFQAKNGQLPMEFYQHVHQTIAASGLSTDVRKSLYSLIAAATTETKTVATIKSLEAAKQDANQIIKSMTDTPLKGTILDIERIKEMVRLNLYSGLVILPDIPPLPVLNRLFMLITSSLNGMTRFYQNFTRLGQACRDLSTNVKQYGSAVYEGMRDYSATDYGTGGLFYDHMALINKIDEKKNIDVNSRTSLIRIISSFHLQAADLDSIISNYFTVANDPERAEALMLLTKLAIIPELTPLKAANLDGILSVVKNRGNTPVVDVFKTLMLANGTPLANYFPASLLENYGNPKTPQDVLNKIDSKFPLDAHRKQISNILSKFSANGDAAKHGEIVDKLIAICEPLSAVEKNIFLSKLASAQGLYTNLKSLNDQDNPLVNLLDAIIARDSTDEFINVVAAERHSLRHSDSEQVQAFFKPEPRTQEPVIENLADKTFLYLQILLPSIKAIDNLNISAIELTPIVLDTLLKTSLDELQGQSNIEKDEKIYFEQQNATLAKTLTALNDGKKIDFLAAQKTTATLVKNGGLKDKASLSRFEKSLQEQQDEIGLLDKVWLAANPAFKKLLAPQSMTTAERDKYEPKIKQLTEKYPSLLMNQGLVTVIINNYDFLHAFAQRNVLDAAESRDLLDNDQKLDLVAAALAKDLEGVATFQRQTQELQSEMLKATAELNSYPHVFTDLFTKINTVVTANPSSKKQFMELLDRYLQHYRPGLRPAAHGELIEYLTDFVSTLEKTFAKITDKNIVLSLCLQFNSDDKEELQPESLLTLLSEVVSVPATYQTVVLKIAISLINNAHDYDFEAFKQLCAVTKKNPQFAQRLLKIYHTPPFPSIAQVLAWHAEASNTGINYNDAMNAHYNAFDLAPSLRDHSLNGFNVDKAKAQLVKLKGFDPNTIDLEQFKNITDKMQKETTAQLLAIFAQFNPANASYDPTLKEDTLVAVAAELFYRSKGMEINTTQYLAIYSMLATPGHVTSQIGTGEGKSRIMMIANACQFARGKTVDFVTSDAQLATRDFVEYQTYFEMMGAETGMILADSAPATYKKGGINFSDPSNLSLFRNKARSLGQDKLVIADLDTNRALLLDEADKTYFDVADTRFNFSREGEASIRGMEWVYPLLMEYLAQNAVQLITPLDRKTSISPLDLYYEDIDLSREKFLQFVSASGRCPVNQLMRLKALSTAQIEQWQASAVTASQLKFKEDFVIEPDVLINTPKGPKISSEAQLIFANRVSKNSKFSFGVHQCLHARLNLARTNPDGESDKPLTDALSKCEQAFYVPDEKQIVYSSTSKNLLDDYKNGSLKAVTGTSGSIIEREEARQLYGLDTQQMHFIDVPRGSGLNRRDKAIRLTADNYQQLWALVEQIKEARANNQPILIVAEDDKESELLFKKLGAFFKEDQNIQHVHDQLPDKEQKIRITKAGLPRQVTISTAMIGRGTDIILKGSAQKRGLHVMTTYLPRPRDMQQIFGRAGRFGAAGSARLVLDKQRLKKALGKTTLTDGFYTHTEAYIERQQALMDRTSQRKRLIKNTVGDFIKGLSNNFYNKMLSELKPADRIKLTPIWSAFFEKSDKAWNEQWQPIQQQLGREHVNLIEISRLLGEYHKHAEKLWENLRRDVHDTKVVCNDGVSKPVDHLKVKLDPLVLIEAAQNLLTQFDLKQYPLDKVTVWSNYDRAHAGRAVTYKHWYTPVIASLKGWANLLPFVRFSEARTPFANTRAWLAGSGQLFADTRAGSNKGKIIGAAILGVLGAAAGVALMLTGVLAPLGIALLGLTPVVTTTIIAGAAGLAAGALAGFAGGTVIDATARQAAPKDEEVLKAATTADEPVAGSYDILNAMGLIERENQTSEPKPPLEPGNHRKLSRINEEKEEDAAQEHSNHPGNM